jgi:glycosyltransferase involved in cell wall biosynthesis
MADVNEPETLEPSGDYTGPQRLRPTSPPKDGLRIVVIAEDRYPPTRVDVAVLFGDELTRRGHRIDWILQSEGPCQKAHRVTWKGGNVWVAPTDLGTSLFSRVRKHALGIAHDLKMFSLLRHGNYDIVEVKDKFVSGIFAVIAARVFRKRFVYWLSYPLPEDYLYRAKDGTGRYPFLYRVRGTIFKFLLYRILLPAADHVFVQSEQMRRDVAAEGVPLAKMTAVPMGIAIDDAAVRKGASDMRKVIPESDRCFLYLGNLAKVRRLDFLVRVLAKVREDIPDAKLYMVGRGDDPSDEQLLVDEARRLNLLPALVLVGQLSRADALEYVREADVCVSPFYPTPTLNSTSPTKLVEYMAMGRPVVANDHPEQRLVIEESGGGYCVPWDEGAFAAAIVRLLTAPETAKEMGERGRRYVAEHRAYPKIADLVERELYALSAPRRSNRA